MSSQLLTKFEREEKHERDAAPEGTEKKKRKYKSHKKQFIFLSTCLWIINYTDHQGNYTTTKTVNVCKKVQQIKIQVLYVGKTLIKSDNNY